MLFMYFFFFWRVQVFRDTNYQYVGSFLSFLNITFSLICFNHLLIFYFFFQSGPPCSLLFFRSFYYFLWYFPYGLHFCDHFLLFFWGLSFTFMLFFCLSISSMNCCISVVSSYFCAGNYVIKLLKFRAIYLVTILRSKITLFLVFLCH